MKKYVVTISVLVGILLATNWNRVCFLSGKAYAKANLMTGSRITYGYGLAGPQNDTTWLMDSLLYGNMGYRGRGAGCAIGPAYAAFIDGYNSIYRFDLERNVYPIARKMAKEILQSRPKNWKDGLSEDRKKARVLLFEKE